MYKDMSALVTAIGIGCFGMAGIANAGLISDTDLNTFSFDVTSYSWTTDQFTDAVASGTSNGVGWSIGPTSLWSGRTTTDGSFSFSALPNRTDNLHPGGNYTITFNQKVASLLVALSNDNGTDSINFGLTPSDTQGVSFSGTQAILDSAAGGLVLFENINSLTIHNVNNNGIDDGYDLAFHVVATTPDAGGGGGGPTVPEPSLLTLMGLGLAGIGFSRKRKRAV